MDVAVFGDVGGQGSLFLNALEELNIDLENCLIPEDLTIIQLGDLIHKGPDSDLIVSFVDELLEKNPDNWVQLSGNHELQHCYGHIFFPCYCSPETVRTLREWWNNSEMQMAVQIRHDSTDDMFTMPDTLVTHAGLTHDLWEEVPGDELSSWVKYANEQEFYRLSRATGLMLGESRNFRAGPIWAHCLYEVYESWSGTAMPFNQIHGHTAPFVYWLNNWFNVPQEWRDKITLNWDLKTSMHRPHENGGTFFSVDQTYQSIPPKNIRSMPYLRIKNASVVQV